MPQKTTSKKTKGKSSQSKLLPPSPTAAYESEFDRWLRLFQDPNNLE